MQGKTMARRVRPRPDQTRGHRGLWGLAHGLSACALWLALLGTVDASISPGDALLPPPLAADVAFLQHPMRLVSHQDRVCGALTFVDEDAFRPSLAVRCGLPTLRFTPQGFTPFHEPPASLNPVDRLVPRLGGTLFWRDWRPFDSLELATGRRDLALERSGSLPHTPARPLASMATVIQTRAPWPHLERGWPEITVLGQIRFPPQHQHHPFRPAPASVVALLMAAHRFPPLMASLTLGFEWTITDAVQYAIRYEADLQAQVHATLTLGLDLLGHWEPFGMGPLQRTVDLALKASWHPWGTWSLDVQGQRPLQTQPGLPPAFMWTISLTQTF